MMTELSYLGFLSSLLSLSLSVSQHGFRQDSTERLALAPPRSVRSKRSSGRLSGCERVNAPQTLLHQQSNQHT